MPPEKRMRIEFDEDEYENLEDLMFDMDSLLARSDDFELVGDEAVGMLETARNAISNLLNSVEETEETQDVVEDHPAKTTASVDRSRTYSQRL